MDVACLGILVADVICRPVDEVPERGTLGLVDEIELRGGGCALNTASALTRLGLRAGVAGKVGADAFGDFVLGLLDERGVDRRGVLRDARVPNVHHLGAERHEHVGDDPPMTAPPEHLGAHDHRAQPFGQHEELEQPLGELLARDVVRVAAERGMSPGVVR